VSGGRPSTIEIALRLDGEAAEAVCALFEQHGGGAVVETLCSGRDGTEEHWVRTYIAATDVDARARIEVGLWHLGRIYPLPEAAVRSLAEANWAEAWKEHFQPLRVGGRFLITPSWVDTLPEAGELRIRLDPGMAFGTGLHPTTQLCLSALARLVTPGDHVLDVGTGSGILAIAAGLLGAGRCVGVDLDPGAVETAAANAARNGVVVEAVTGGVHQAPAGLYDVVVANLLAPIIVQLADALFERARPGGCCIASGLLAEQAFDVATALRQAGFDEPQAEASGDWLALTARRPGGSKR